VAADILAFAGARDAPPQAAPPAEPALVVPFPSIVAYRVWLGRESARIAGMQSGASIRKVIQSIRGQHFARGIPQDLAKVDADLAEAFMKGRIEFLRSLDAPAPRGPEHDGGRRA
jgi:hypothetical protein